MKQTHRTNSRSGYQQAVKILQQACSPEEVPTPERMEENLRWLVHVTLPPVQAPERLRQRVRALAEAHRAWQQAQRADVEELSRWAELEAALREPEREMLALLLTADIQQLPEAFVRRAEVQRVMRQLLAALPEPLREALLLQVSQDLAIPEIADVLECSEGEAIGLLRQVRMSIFRQALGGFRSTALH